MVGDEFYNFEEETFSELISKCEEAYDQGTLEALHFTEEEFEFLINHFIDEMDDDIVYIITGMGYKQHPYSTDLVIRYADVLIVNGETDEAIEILLKQISLDPSNSDIHFLIARVYIKKEDRETTSQYLESALSLTTTDGIDMLLTASQDYIDSYMYEHAVDLLKRAESMAPKHQELINDLAFCYERMGLFELSMSYYQKYLDIDPFNDNVWFNVGTIYARELKFNKAIEAFDYAIAINPENSSVFYNKAILLVNSDQYDQAIATFSSFLELEPYNLFALSGIGYAYLAKDKIEDAEKYFKLAMAEDSLYTDAVTGMAYIGMIRQDDESTKLYLNRVIGGFETDYSFIIGELLTTYKRTKNPEILIAYLTALYNLKELELFYIYIEILLAYDSVWLAKLYELVPELKIDDSVIKRINKIKKNFN